ncbi:MAG: MBL fold metallo-hydrolase [Candidatus Eremiobacteraeota bacterium]|nr:MBL fold metallo-hydrolase [Candidatus Eremiobacteraeota bacterium]
MSASGAGRGVPLSERVARLRANNASPMTLDGTNGYVVRVGPRSLVAIDPGPVDDAQREAFLAAARGASAAYAAILVTHGHPDHFPGAAPLAEATGAPVYAHPDARFPHDRALAQGERLAFDDAAFTVLHAPGHAHDHLVFVLDDERALFTGDVVIGTGTVVVAPPGGDMRTYQRTLHRLRDEYGGANAIYGGHGPEVRDVRAKLDEYIAHREMRERQIVDALHDAADTIPALVAHVYADVDRRLWPAAARQILAYLLALEAECRVRAERVGRGPTPQEAALLNPDLSKLGDDADADVIRAELGYGRAEPLLRYVLV